MVAPRVIQKFIRDTIALDAVRIEDPGTGEEVEPYEPSHNELVIVDDGVPVQLPEPQEGTVVVIKCVSGANTDVLAPPGSRIDGNTQRRFKDLYQALSIVSTGDEWETKEQLGDPIERIDASRFVLSNLKILPPGTTPDPENDDQSIDTSVTGSDVVVHATLTNGGTVGAKNTELVFETIPDTEEENPIQTVVAETGDILLQPDEQTQLSFTVTLDQGIDDYNVILRTPDSTLSREFEILPTATDITVSNLTAPSNVADGDQITASADLENLGQSATDVPINLTIDGNVVDSTTISNFEYNTTQSVSLNYTVDKLANSATLAITSPQNSQSQALSITFPNPLILIDDFSVQSVAYPGEQIEATVDTNNLGPSVNDVSIEFILNIDTSIESNIETQIIDYAEEGSATVTFTYTNNLELGNYTLSARTPDRTETQSFKIEWPRTKFTASNIQSPSTAAYGDTITVSADIENQGEPADAEVDLRVGEGYVDTNPEDGTNIPGRVVEEQTLTNLDIFDPQTVTFDYRLDIAAEQGSLGIFAPPDSEVEGPTAHRVLTDIDITTGIPEIVVRDIQAPSVVETNETIEVTAELENIAQGDINIPIELALEQNGTRVNTLESKDVNMFAGEIQQITFTHTVIQTAGSYDIGIFSNDGFSVQPLEIQFSPTEPLIETLDAPNATYDGQQITVESDIFNRGEPSSTIEVELVLDEGLATEEVLETEVIDVGYRETVTASITHNVTLGFGNYTIGTRTSVDSQNQSLSVPQPGVTLLDEQYQENIGTPEDPEIVQRDLNINEPVFNDGTLSVDAVIDNEGPPQTDVTIKLALSGYGIVSTNDIDLDFLETRTVTLEYNLPSVPEGSYTVDFIGPENRLIQGTTILNVRPDIVTDNNSEVDPQYRPPLSSPNTTYNGQTVSLGTQVRNNGKPSSDITVTFYRDLDEQTEEVIDTRTLTLGYEEYSEVDTTYTVDEQPGNYTFSVVTSYPEDARYDEVTNNTSVLDTTTTVDNISAPNRTYESESITISSDITNSGHPSSNITAELVLDVDENSEQVLDTQTLNIGFQETVNASFNYTITQPVGDYTISIRTTDDIATQGISVLDPTLNVSNLNTPSVPEADTQISVSADITNIGAPATGESVRATVDGIQQAEQIIDIGHEATQNISFSFTLTPQSEVASIGIETDDDSATRDVLVQFNAFFVLVDNLDAPLTVGRDDNVDLSAVLTNIGEGGFGIGIDLIFDEGGADEVIIDSEDIEMEADEELLREYQFNVANDLGTDLFGEYTIGVYSPNGSATQSFTIESPGLLVSNLVAPDTLEPDQEFTISADVTNEGDEVVNTPVRVVSDRGTNDATILGAQELDFAIDETRNVSFTVDANVDLGERDIGIYTRDDGESKIINVTTGIAEFQPTITSGTILGSNFTPTVQSESVPAHFGVSVTNTQELVSDFQPTITSGGVLGSTFEITQEGDESVDTFFGVSIEDTQEVSSN